MVTTAGSQIPGQESDDLICVYVFKWGLAGGVVAAGEDHGFYVYASALKLVLYLAGEFRQKGKIVAGINQQNLFGEAREFIEICHGADAQPRLPQAFLAHAVALQSFPDMAGRLSGRSEERRVGKECRSL